MDMERAHARRDQAGFARADTLSTTAVVKNAATVNRAPPITINQHRTLAMLLQSGDLAQVEVVSMECLDGAEEAFLNILIRDPSLHSA